MFTPDTLHNIILVLCFALLAGFAWQVGTWAAGLLNTTGHIIALCLLLILLVILVFGKV